MRPLAALAFAALAASPVYSLVTVPLTRLHRTGAYLKGAPDADRARAKLFKSRAHGPNGGPNTVPASNVAYMQYVTTVGIGRPPAYYHLLVDTGSSNTFCGIGAPYVRTRTSVPTGQDVNVTYGTGSFAGVEYLDQVTLAPGLVIANQSIGDALSFAHFQDVDGIIGVGPADLTWGTLSPDRNATVTTVMNNLVLQGLIEHAILGVYFSPPKEFNDTNGALTYGGVDPSLYRGKLTYVPVTDTDPAGHYWGINVTSVKYGTHSILSTSTAGIVDTGTTQVLLADDLFDAYMHAIPGAKFDNATGLLEIPPSSIPHLKPLRWSIGGREWVMNAASQLVPSYQDTAIGGVSGKQYGVVGKLGSPSGEGLDFILGQKFIERYYVAFDAERKRIGLAQTNETWSGVEG